MDHRWQRFRSLVLLLGTICACPAAGLAQARDQTASEAVRQVMAAALAHCHIKADFGEAVTFIPPSNAELETIRSLGADAIEPLSAYLDAKRGEGGFTQLFAVKFLMALRSPAALDALQRAFAQDQWEVTRMAALDGMFETSKVAAKPYIKKALEDESPVVRHLAENLWVEYEPPKLGK